MHPQEKKKKEGKKQATISARLLDAESEIIRVWEDRVREQIPLADEHSSQVLRNSLPSFIIGVAKVLAENAEGEDFKAVCQKHGEQRAEKTYYSVEQLVHEYRILREVIFELIEGKEALDSRSRQLINLSVDHGLAEAVTSFIRRVGLEREQAEKNLLESEERHDLALKAGKIGIWEMDLKSPRIKWSSRQFEIFDVDSSIDPLTYDTFQKCVHPEDKPRMALELDRAVREKRDFLLEYRVIWRDGTIHWVKASGRPYYDTDGNPDRMMGTNIDITTMKAEQDQRHELIDSLTREQEIRERFVNALTHDLRTPLTAAKMSGQLVARMASRPDDVVRLAARVVDNLNRADEMISDLLDSSRIRAGLPLALDIKECEARAVVVATLEELTIIHGNRFVVESGSEVRGYWDCKGVRRILENLCSNAVKYGDAHAPIYVACRREAAELVLSVKNTGAPLGTEEKMTLFNLFERTESARSLGRKGWGIGLTVVKGIAESHGGSAEVQSDAGSTIFTVRLPLDARNFLSAR
ncbi:MAG: PAS domain-containing protein [Bacteriovoracia bacterium]